MYFQILPKHVSNRHYSVQYSIPDSTTAAPGNELGIFESLDVHYSRKDLDIYFSTLYP
jgi:tripeptidyl-peptidase I